MLFPYDYFGPSFTALQQPSSKPLSQPQVAPTGMFNGTIPGWQHGPIASTPDPVYHAIRPFTAPIRSLLGRNVDVRG